MRVKEDTCLSCYIIFSYFFTTDGYLVMNNTRTFENYRFLDYSSPQIITSISRQLHFEMFMRHSSMYAFLIDTNNIANFVGEQFKTNTDGGWVRSSTYNDAQKYVIGYYVGYLLSFVLNIKMINGEVQF